MKNRNPLLHTPDGVRDIYGSEFAQKFELKQQLFHVLEERGYQGIETPSFEFFDVFSKEVGTIPSRELYKFFDKEGNTLVLRPDMTPSIARAVSKYFSGGDPIRLCYMGNTFINYDKYRGHLRETTQLGAELMGDGSTDADVEVISVLVEALKDAGLKEFQVSIGNVGFFKALVREAGIGDAAEELRQLISDKNRFGAEELLSHYEIPEGLKATFLEIAALSGSAEVLTRARMLTANPDALASVERLEIIYRGLTAAGLEKYISFDLSMLSKHNYYTGTVFKAYTYGYGEPVAKGGRYDTLLSHFGKEMPAVGFAIVVDQLQKALTNTASRAEETTSGEKRYLTFALTKGRLAKQTLSILEKTGITCEEMKDPDSRRLIFVNEEQRLKFFLAKGPDVPTYVEYGAADIGVVGKDTLVEEGRKMYEVLDLGVGRCRMCVCGPQSAREKLEHREQIRVATKYPDIAKDYFYNKKHQTVEIIKLNGSIELAPLVGLSDVIVDIVETGSTLRENGLVVLEEIMPLSARMVVNQVSMRMEQERISGIIEALKKALA